MKTFFSLLLLSFLAFISQAQTQKITYDSTYQVCDSVFASVSFDTTITVFIGDTCYYKKKWWGNKFICNPLYRTFDTTEYITKKVLKCDSVTSSFTKIINVSKSQIKGLMVRSFDWINTFNPDLNFLKTVNGIVIRLNWSDLQPTETGPLNTSYIENALSFAATMKKNGVQVQYKLRIVNGIYAPQWLKDKAGYFTITGSQSGNIEDIGSGTCPRFWNPVYVSYWAALQNKLSALYDGNEFISEIVNSCTAIGSGEALIRAVGNAGALKDNKLAYLAAGYTSAADLSAVYASINAMKVWKSTNVGMSLTPWQVINSGPVTEENNTTSLITDSLCKAFTVRAAIGNNGLRTGDSKSGSDWVQGGIMYDLAMRFITFKTKYKASIFYQTATSWRTGVPITDVINQGIYFGASCIELPDGQKTIQENLTADQLLLNDTILSEQ